MSYAAYRSLRRGTIETFDEAGYQWRSKPYNCDKNINEALKRLGVHNHSFVHKHKMRRIKLTNKLMNVDGDGI